MNLSTLSGEFADDEDYLLDIKDIAIGPLIGQGQFATVYLGKYFGDYVAVKKQVREAKLLETYLIREISLLQKAKHENLISFFGAYNEVNDDGCQHALYIVTEFCQGGDLLELLVNNPQKLGWKFRINIALQAASAINYLHENNFIHRDIKSSNLLIDQDWQCKICDFGMAVEIDPDVSRRMTLCGTAEYMAPELMFDEQSYLFEIDIFSLGMVLLEVLKRGKVGHGGFAERAPRTMFRLDDDVIRSMLPPDSPDSLVALALQCVSDDPTLRPASSDVVDWLQDLYDTSLDDVTPPPRLAPVEWNASEAEASRSFGGNEESVWTAILSADASPKDRLQDKVQGKVQGKVTNGVNPPLPPPTVSTLKAEDLSVDLSLDMHVITPNKVQDSPMFYTPFTARPAESPADSPAIEDDDVEDAEALFGGEPQVWEKSQEDGEGNEDDVTRLIPADESFTSMDTTLTERTQISSAVRLAPPDSVPAGRVSFPHTDRMGSGKVLGVDTSHTEMKSMCDITHTAIPQSDSPAPGADRGRSSVKKGSASPAVSEASRVSPTRGSGRPIAAEAKGRASLSGTGGSPKVVTAVRASSPIPAAVARTSSPIPVAAARTSSPIPAAAARTSSPIPTAVARTSNPKISRSSSPIPTESKKTSPSPSSKGKVSTPVSPRPTSSPASRPTSSRRTPPLPARTPSPVPAMPLSLSAGAAASPSRPSQIVSARNTRQLEDDLEDDLEDNTEDNTEVEGEVEMEVEGEVEGDAREKPDESLSLYGERDRDSDRSSNVENNETENDEVGTAARVSAKAVDSDADLALANKRDSMGGIGFGPGVGDSNRFPPSIFEYEEESVNINDISDINDESRLDECCVGDCYLDTTVMDNSITDTSNINDNTLISDSNLDSSAQTETNLSYPSPSRGLSLSLSPTSPKKSGRLTHFKVPPLTSQNSASRGRTEVDIYYLGILFKKNSTGFFRNWKKVCVTISGSCLKWTSSTDVRSKLYSLKGASVVRTMQFRFQVSNMLETKEPGTVSSVGKDAIKKPVSREFAAESEHDMEEWILRLEACIDRADSGVGSAVSMGSVSGSEARALRKGSSSSNSSSPLKSEGGRDAYHTADTYTETQSNGSQPEGEYNDESSGDRERARGRESEEEDGGDKCTPLTAPISATSPAPATPSPQSPDLSIGVTKFRSYGPDVTLFTVVSCWCGNRSSLSMHYTDVAALNTAMLGALKDSPLLLRQLPVFPTHEDFHCTIDLFQTWCLTQDKESDHKELKGKSDPDLKAYLQQQTLSLYMVALGDLVDRTPHLQLLLELLEVLPAGHPVPPAFTSAASNSSIMAAI